ncbi:hypothetical protein QVD99_001864 [Batrachochytrium dendrobatidis]|nr:hypothetical protein O5D80_000508 [Batrachochytrium dendrobatidis]KAK5672047.1 hypothetical protein QVD99_001864 [Batrachochytrium dendrobatidis]
MRKRINMQREQRGGGGAVEPAGMVGGSCRPDLKYVLGLMDLQHSEQGINVIVQSAPILRVF